MIPIFRLVKNLSSHSLYKLREYSETVMNQVTSSTAGLLGGDSPAETEGRNSPELRGTAEAAPPGPGSPGTAGRRHGAGGYRPTTCPPRCQQAAILALI